MRHRDHLALRNIAATSFSVVAKLCLKQVPVEDSQRDDLLAESLVGTYGEIMGANRKLCELATRLVRRRFRKMWPELNEKEQAELKMAVPVTARFLQTLYQHKIMRETGVKIAANGMQMAQGTAVSRFCLSTVTHLIDGCVSPLEEKYGNSSMLMGAISCLHEGDLEQSFSHWFRALQDHGKTNEVRCCRELLMAEIAHQQSVVRRHLDEETGFGVERTQNYLESLRSIERRIHFLK